MSNNSWIEKAEQTARDVLARHADEVDRSGRWPTESVASLAAAGFFGLTVPRAWGGAEAGPRTFAAVTRALAGQCASTAMIYLMHVCGARVIAAATQFGRREEVLRRIASGRELCTLAFSEKGSRSHFWAPISQAKADGDRHVLSAQKSWVTSAGHADSYMVSTRAAGGGDPRASTLYYVPGNAAGFRRAGSWNGLGLRGNASAPMLLEGVTVSAADRLSGDGDGFDVMIAVVLPWFQLGSAAVSLGLARAATEATRQHLLNSKLEHLGQSLASLANLRARLAQMQIIADTQSAFVEAVAGQMENPGPTTMLAVLESKAAAAEAALEVTDLAMRVCGGAAFSKQVGVERLFRDARAASVMAPTTDVLYEFIGKGLLGMPLF